MLFNLIKGPGSNSNGNKKVKVVKGHSVQMIVCYLTTVVLNQKPFKRSDVSKSQGPGHSCNLQNCFWKIKFRESQNTTCSLNSH